MNHKGKIIFKYRQRLLLVLLLLSFAALNTACHSKSEKRAKSTDYLSIKKISDGDTFWVDDGTAKGIKIRLIGVDAPESRNAFRKKKGYFGIQAKEYLTCLLEGRRVRLEYDVVKKDRFGRTLAYVYLEDGTFVNADLVKNGYAMVMTIPPNVKFADVFVGFQREARENNRGLWNEPKESQPNQK